jgi:hypothetical protein
VLRGVIASVLATRLVTCPTLVSLSLSLQQTVTQRLSMRTMMTMLRRRSLVVVPHGVATASRRRGRPSVQTTVEARRWMTLQQRQWQWQWQQCCDRSGFPPWLAQCRGQRSHGRVDTAGSHSPACA